MTGILTKGGLVGLALTAAVALTACDTNTAKTSGGGGGHHSSSSATKSKPSKPKYSVTQENAIKSAQSYLSLGNGFSRAGLINQLSSKAGEGFKMADAVFAVNHIKVDYNKQAVLSARNYLSIDSFSRSGLIEQLSSKAGDGFTVAQATYAADKVGLK